MNRCIINRWVKVRQKNADDFGTEGLADLDKQLEIGLLPSSAYKRIARELSVLLKTLQN